MLEYGNVSIPFRMSIARRVSPAKPKPRVQRGTPPILALKGWSATAAAEALGCDPSHLIRVAYGERHSKSLSARIAALPDLTK